MGDKYKAKKSGQEACLGGKGALQTYKTIVFLDRLDKLLIENPLNKRILFFIK